jgi:hypothetical protein
MDSSSLIIGLVVVALFVLPIVILRRKKNKEE